MQRTTVALTVFLTFGAPRAFAQGRGGGPPPPPPIDTKAVLDGAARAIGADKVTSIQYSGTGTNNAFGQQWGPNRPWPAFKVTSYTATVNYTMPAMQVELERTNPDGPARGGGGIPLAAPQKQIAVVSGNLAWNVAAGPGGPTATPAPATVADRVLQLWSTPHGAIRAAQKAGAVTATQNGSDRILTFLINGTTMRVTVTIDDTVSSVETVSDTPMMGDTVTETKFLNYKQVSEGIRFPTHIRQTQGGFQVLDLQITDIKANVPAAIDVPPNVRQAPPAASAPIQVDVQKAADGVYYLTGGTHHSVAIEFGDHVVLVEAPLNEQRVQAVLAAVKKTIPNKPIRYVVNTHDHFDHAGGLRAVAAEGIPIITQTSNTYYYAKVFSMPHTIVWDGLTQTGKQPIFEGIDDKRTLSDATRQLQLIRVSTDHSDTMLVAYLPKEKILIEADLFNPPAPNAAPAPVNPVTASFYDALQQLKLDVNQVLPLHGRMVTMRDLQIAVGKTGG
jgi:glyoxylase-like metal-dependent hydrolase (beta-lactamase superfamily II)